ncbi:hypothetical protein Zmor_026274 [Zophobas morio]|uniref:Tyr recombinase domain-containing protein n=1 Tax=Zophobas morio TaxID=2755281 RepID=A0AA38HVQ1_9CUCU|nr:hypothetical protein Zmor_026274 [Zophobas morio]
MNPEEELPPDVLEEAQNVVLNLLPTKSREVYECAYTRFIKWCEGKKIQTYSENVLLVYFSELATKMKSSTLWSHYSMVKATLNIKNGIEIGKYSKLKAFIKKQGEGYVPKKSRVLTNEQIEVFLDTAPDFKFLMMKIVVIFGVSGACRCHELLQIKTEDIENIKAGLLVKIPDTKTKKPRSFTVMGEKYLKFFSFGRTRNVREVNLEESGTSSGTTNRMITREDGISRNVGAVNLNFDTVTNQTAGAVEVLAQNIITDRMKNDNSDGKSLIQINRSCSYFVSECLYYREDYPRIFIIRVRAERKLKPAIETPPEHGQNGTTVQWYQVHIKRLRRVVSMAMV